MRSMYWKLLMCLMNVFWEAPKLLIDKHRLIRQSRNILCVLGRLFYGGTSICADWNIAWKRSYRWRMGSFPSQFTNFSRTCSCRPKNKRHYKKMHQVQQREDFLSTAWNLFLQLLYHGWSQLSYPKMKMDFPLAAGGREQFPIGNLFRMVNRFQSWLILKPVSLWWLLTNLLHSYLSMRS